MPGAGEEGKRFIWQPGDVRPRPVDVLPRDLDVRERLNLPNRGRFAANDPRIPIASSGGGSLIGRIASLIGRGSGILTAASAIASITDELSKQRLEEAFRGAENVLKKRLLRRNRERALREVLVRSPVAGLPAEQSGLSPAAFSALQVPTAPPSRPVSTGDGIAEFERPAVVSRATRPRIDADSIDPFGAGGLQRPGQVEPGVFGVGAPGITPAGLPGGQTAGDFASDLASDIAQEIASQAAPQPVFGTPAVPQVFPSPVSFPVFQPVSFPVFQPVGDPGLTSLQEPVRRFQPGDDPFGEVLDFPDPLKDVATDPARQRRCKPCKEDNPQPRDACFKGLYREGALDTQVDFVEWAEIDCLTGVEL